MSDRQIKMLQVSAIQDGTVIDHIDSRRTFQVAGILRLQDVDETVLIGMNLDSHHGKKGIIKVGGRRLTQEEVNKIALIAPDATLNIIEGYRVVEKREVRLPDTIEGTMKCFNPNCITNDQVITNKFDVVSRDPITMRCHYCERQMGLRDVKLL